MNILKCLKYESYEYPKMPWMQTLWIFQMTLKTKAVNIIKALKYNCYILKCLEYESYEYPKMSQVQMIWIKMS